MILGGERGHVPLEATGGDVVAKLVVEGRVSVLIDLSLLRNKPLTVLSFRGRPITDLSLLSTFPLRDVAFDFNPWRDTERLKAIKTLEKINYKTAAEFWK